jgi:cytochrome P450
MVDRVVAAAGFDGVTDVAHELPLNLIMDLIGWPERVRTTLRGMAEGAFEVCGPIDNPRMQASLPRLQSMMQLIAEVYDNDELVPGGFGSTIADSARRGEIAREDAIGLLAGYVVAAFDTTISGIGSGLWLFAQHPDQWDLVRREPALVPRAFNEILRMETPIQHFGRVAARDVDIGEGIIIPAGSRVVVSYAAANRDERHFPDPDRFDIRRSPSDHLAFGHGNHACAGQGLARLEAHAVFRALAARVTRFEPDGAAQRARTAFTRGLDRLPLRAIG